MIVYKRKAPFCTEKGLDNNYHSCQNIIRKKEPGHGLLHYKARLEIKDLLGFEGFAVCFFGFVSVFRSVAYDVNGASAAFILLYQYVQELTSHRTSFAMLYTSLYGCDGLSKQYHGQSRQDLSNCAYPLVRKRDFAMPTCTISNEI